MFGCGESGRGVPGCDPLPRNRHWRFSPGCGESGRGMPSCDLMGISMGEPGIGEPKRDLGSSIVGKVWRFFRIFVSISMRVPGCADSGPGLDDFRVSIITSFELDSF